MLSGINFLTQICFYRRNQAECGILKKPFTLTITKVLRKN